MKFSLFKILLLTVFFVVSFFSFHLEANTINKSGSNKIYTNSRFGYTIKYPDFFETVAASDNGDGITLNSADKKAVLLIWGSYNINDKDGNSLLDDVIKRGIKTEVKSSGKNFYSLSFTDPQKKGTVFYEYGIVKGDKIAVFQLGYPSGAKDYDKAISLMKKTLKYPNDISVLLDAIVYSESIHYDPFTEKPDSLTVNYVIHYLVQKKCFADADNPDRVFTPEGGAYYFSDGPESEEEHVDPKKYFSPDKLYRSYFASSRYQYPPGDFRFVLGTQTGIAVPVVELQYSAKTVILKESGSDKIKVFEVSIIRRVKPSAEPVKIGTAVIKLKKDDKSYFGYTILSFKPNYTKFPDLTIK